MPAKYAQTTQRRPGSRRCLSGERRSLGLRAQVRHPDDHSFGISEIVETLGFGAHHRRLVRHRAGDRKDAPRRGVRPHARVAHGREGRGRGGGAGRARDRGGRLEAGGLRARRRGARRARRRARRARQLGRNRDRGPGRGRPAEASRPPARDQPARAAARHPGGDPAPAQDEGLDRQPRLDRGHDCRSRFSRSTPRRRRL